MNGTFQQPEADEDDMMVLKGSAPVSMMRDYQTQVTSYTKGRGRLFCSLKGYAPCQNQDEIVEEIGYDSERDLDNPTGSVFCAHGAGFVVPWYEVEDYMHLEGIDESELGNTISTAASTASETSSGTASGRPSARVQLGHQDFAVQQQQRRHGRDRQQCPEHPHQRHAARDAHDDQRGRHLQRPGEQPRLDEVGIQLLVDEHHAGDHEGRGRHGGADKAIRPHSAMATNDPTAGIAVNAIVSSASATASLPSPITVSTVNVRTPQARPRAASTGGSRRSA